MTNSTDPSVPPLFVLHEHTDSVLCCDFFPSTGNRCDDSKWFISGDAGGVVILWNLDTRHPLLIFSPVAEGHQLQREKSSHDRYHASCAANGCSLECELNSRSGIGEIWGPHSRSVLSVGFIPLARAPLPATSRATRTAVVRSSVVEKPLTHPMSDSAFRYHPSSSSFASAKPLRPRFRLSRRADIENSKPRETQLSPHSSVIVAALPDPSSLEPSLCFYTHCRDQRVYLWTLNPSQAPDSCVPRATALKPHLLAVLTVPQHGFCPVESCTEATGALMRTYISVPHETGGEVTIWEVAWSVSSTLLRASDSGSEGETRKIERRISSELQTEEDELGEIDVSDLNPLDALIARATAKNQQRESHTAEIVPSTSVAARSTVRPYDGNRLPVSDGSGAGVLRSNRSSVLCYLDSSLTSAMGNISIKRLCTFSACPTFKGGIIMRMTMCSDAQHLTVAFESGHVVLARYRQTDRPDNVASSPEMSQTSRSVAEVRVVTRAFAESALVCWWSGRRVLTGSAEGVIHCYDLSSGEGETRWQLELMWSVTLRKGIGSLLLQANLVVAGCWDSTLRLYDVRDGHLVSILSFQRGTINEVRVAPSSMSRGAAFGFDVRHPRCYAAPTPALKTIGNRFAPGVTPDLVSAEKTHESDVDAKQNVTPSGNSEGGDRGDTVEETDEDELVYLFASASNDGTLAVWRIDMGIVFEQCVLKQ